MQSRNETVTSPGYSWTVVIFLMLLYICSYIDRTIMALLVGPIRSDLGINDTQYSLLAGFSFAVLYALAGIPLGWVVDRWSRRGLIAIGVAVWSVMTAACGLANSFWALFAARIGVGTGEATLSPAAYSLVSDSFPPQKLSRALSVFALGIPIGTGLTNLIGGPLVQGLSKGGPIDVPLGGAAQPWQAVFFVVGLPGLLLALLTLWVIREPARRETTAVQIETAPPLSAVLAYLWQHKGMYIPIFLGMAFIALFCYGASAWFPALLQRRWGFTVREAGLFLGTCILVLGILGSMTAGTLADHWMKHGYKDAHLRVGILYGLGTLICGALGPVLPIEGLALTFIGLTAFFSMTWVGVNAAVLQLITPNRMRGQISAIYQFVGVFIGVGFGPTAVAAATDYLFKSDVAVGWSLALVSVVFVPLGCFSLHCARKAVRAKLTT